MKVLLIRFKSSLANNNGRLILNIRTLCLRRFGHLFPFSFKSVAVIDAQILVELLLRRIHSAPNSVHQFHHLFGRPIWVFFFQKRSLLHIYRVKNLTYLSGVEKVGWQWTSGVVFLARAFLFIFQVGVIFCRLKNVHFWICWLLGGLRRKDWAWAASLIFLIDPCPTSHLCDSDRGNYFWRL